MLPLSSSRRAPRIIAAVGPASGCILVHRPKTRRREPRRKARLVLH